MQVDHPLQTEYLFNITKDSWEIILSYLFYDSLINAKLSCKEIYFIINKSEYLSYHTLLQFIKPNINYITCLHEYCIGDDMDLHEPKYRSSDLKQQESLQIFSSICFKMMTLFKKSNLFQYYSRLISYNWRIHLISSSDSDHYPLLNVHNKMSEFKVRNLNKYENKFFKSFNKYNIPKHNGLNGLNAIYDFKTFIDHLQIYSFYNQWKHIIFNHNDNNNGARFFLSGGMVVKCLLKLHKEPDIPNMKDLDFFAVNMTFSQFMAKFHKIKLQLISKGFPVIVGGHCNYNLSQISRVQNLYVNFSQSTNLTVPISSGSTYNIKQYQHRLNQWPFRRELSFAIFPHQFPAQHLLKIQMHHTHPLRRYENKMTSQILSQRENLWTLELRDKVCDNHRKMEKIGRLNEEIRWKYNEKQIVDKECNDWIQLQFIHISDVSKPWTILHLFDLDCCQVGFDGYSVLSTHAFMQSVNTQSLINYKFINNPYLIHLFSKRTQKYEDRGFHAMAPIAFSTELDGAYDDDDDELDEYEEFAHKWLNARGAAIHSCFIKDAEVAFKSYGEGGFGLNNDSLGVRKQFIDFLINKLNSNFSN